jgi:hypothetical protein
MQWQALVCITGDPDDEDGAEQEARSIYRNIAAAAAAVQEEPDRISARFTMDLPEPPGREPAALPRATPDPRRGVGVPTPVALPI